MVMADRPPLLVTIVGPTAVGKTDFSLELAESVDGEIISADSRLVYRGLDIGTAKPTQAQRTRVPHHLIDIVDPDDVLTLAQYQRRAYASIDAVAGLGRQPILVGGTGQYVRAVVEGWGIPEIPPDHGLRAELVEYAGHHGAAALHTRLVKLDPTAASRIDFRNVRRVIRALEVTLLAGRPISELQAKTAPPYLILQIGLTRPRPVLYERIDARIDRMLASGLVAEVRRLAAAGYGWDLPAMSGLGYRQIGLYLQEMATLEEAAQFIRRDTRRLVRQQGTWFRLADPHIHWFHLEQVDTDRVVSFVQAWITNPRSPHPA
jgi:tRNA dimethylallyltransferase